MNRLLTAVIPRIAWLYISFVGITSRIVWLNTENERSLKGKNFIYAFWHGRQVFFTYAYKNTPAHILVSQSKDGELIARVIGMFGMHTIRGSSSRGGAKALISLKKALDENRTVAITPDGPKGPQKTISPGVIYLARKTSKPILPVTCSARRKLIFRGWDDYWVPIPFNVMVLNAGKPISVGPDDDISVKSQELQTELDNITEEADRLAG